jgi:hypothetical protein
MSPRITYRFAWAVLLIALFVPCVYSQSQTQAFTEDSLVTVCLAIKTLGEDTVVDMVNNRGVGFHLTESYTHRLRKAGAGDALVKAVAAASKEYDKAATKEPAIGSKAAHEALVEQTKEKTVLVPPPLDEKGQKELIEKARDRALEYTTKLPSFICLQVTQRYGTLQGREQRSKLDTINTRLSFDADHHEDYKVISVNERMVDKKMTDLGGAVSTGEFGSLLQGVFEPATHTTFQWLRQAGLRGHAIEVYGYTVRKEHSQWQLDYNHQQHTYPAYRGLVWVDRETAQVLRLSMSAVEIEKDFPIKSADDTLDYDWATISGYSFLLPQHALMQLSDGSVVMDNDITFRMYRKYTTDSSIKFDLSEDVKDDPPPAPVPPVKKP